MIRYLWLLLAGGLAFGGQEKLLLEETRSFWSASTFNYTVKPNLGKVTQWRLHLAGKILAEGTLDIKQNQTISWKLPKVKDASLIAGHLSLKSNPISYTIPFYVVGNKQFQFKHDRVYILTDQPESINEDTLKNQGLNFEITNTFEAVNSDYLIINNFSLYEALSNELSEFTKNGGKVLFLGECPGELDLKTFGIEKYTIFKKSLMSKSLKGLSLYNFTFSNSWKLNLQEDLIYQKNDSEYPSFCTYHLNNKNGFLWFYSMSIGELLKHQPASVLLIKKFVEKKND